MPRAKKLLQAHYANAIPLDLLREEQARIIPEQGTGLSHPGVDDTEQSGRKQTTAMV